MVLACGNIPDPVPRIYTDLADWYPLLTPVDDYAEEAGFYRRLFEIHSRRPLRTLLDLGSGGGHNAAHLKRDLACTLVDFAPAMLSLSRRINPECEHILGDMRSVRLGRVFDCVLLHDAVSYMKTRTDLGAAVATAFAHAAPGGVVIVQPDFVTETFDLGVDTGGSDANGRALRFLEWRWRPDPNGETYITEIACLLKDVNDVVEVLYDRHVMGLFPKDVWMDTIAGAGFEALAAPFEHSSNCSAGHDVFLGVRPVQEIYTA